MKHPKIRAAILDALIVANGHTITWFDGRPAAFDVSALPAVAVYLTDAQHISDPLDEDGWSAELHIEVIMGASATDTELDEWMETRIYPVLEHIPALTSLIDTLVATGYEYQRDDEFAVWSSATLSYSITYTM